VIRCTFCGRNNDPASKFCLDCGKPVVATGARIIPVPGVAPSGEGGGFAVPNTRVSAKFGGIAPVKTPCRYCQTQINPALPFCPKCGGRAASESGPPKSATACASCSNPVTPGTDVFCARCGARVASSGEPPAATTLPVGSADVSPRQTVGGPKISVLDSASQVSRTVTLETAESSIGRADGELRFGDDVFMSPLHAQLSLRDGQLFLRDLGSRNGTWLYATDPYKLQDGDTILVGSQIIRFRRLGYPGPNPPEADATRRLGSAVPSADVAVLQQLRADGSARDSYHLSPARSVVIGRSEGDWLFPYDQTMSGRHAEIRGEDLEFIVLDLGSRNGIAVAVRGERPVKAGQRILLGDQTLRVESL
jgi:pSer/pThr/pTyr-binding forkhead associated (FHA) protein